MPRDYVFQSQPITQSCHGPRHLRGSVRPSRATWGESHPDLTQLLTLFIVHSPFSSGRHPPDYILTAYKPHAGKLVVGWVTTSESLLLFTVAIITVWFEVRKRMARCNGNNHN
ncbi:unnamed protein product [Penicillium roqueforti FM164]|uniref:Uncharacterized protein n=1 Tax=Penicillium roqueforti (strain FM164) TaxID=1365484 RepID=W6QL52_PENRF|nr:unnamed protein product [Penicillium roqueforti FM164]